MSINEIVENFELLEQWDDRYRYIIELGRTLPELPERARVEANKVQGCASQVWMETIGQAERQGRAGPDFCRRQRRPYRARPDRDPVRALFRQAGAMKSLKLDARRSVREARPARASHPAALQRLPLHGQPHPVGCEGRDGAGMILIAARSSIRAGGRPDPRSRSRPLRRCHKAATACTSTRNGSPTSRSIISSVLGG